MRNPVTRNRFRNASIQTCLIVAFALLLLAPGLALGQTFVQQAQNLPGTGTSATFTAAETAGDFNVVIVGWGDQMSSIASVTDDNSNTYILVGTTGGQNNSQAIYYANSISVSTTTTPTVSANFVKALAGGCDVRVLEYTGFSSSSVTVDNWIGNSGGNSPATSNTFTTSTSSLIVGAGTTGGTFLSGGIPTGLTPLGPNGGINGFGDIAMDSNGAVAAGPYAAGANVTGGWVMQAVGFSISGVTTATPTVTSIAPTSGSTAGGDSVTITGTNFFPGAIALFGTAPGGISLVNCVVTPPTSMTCNTPADNQGPKDLTVVNVDGLKGSLALAFTYTINPPVISSISPAATTTDGNTTITITGASFQAGATVNVGGPLQPSGNGEFGDNVKVLSSTSITFTTPALSVGVADLEVKNPDGGNTTDSGALTYALGTGPINFIQRGDAATGISAQTIPVPMTNPQGKGNLNVVIAGWSDTSAQISTITDTEGNTYVMALPVIQGTSLSQVIYYAKNIKGDGATANTITVKFSGSAASPDIRVLEYSGPDPSNPLDTGMSNAGNGALADTGVCTTTSATEVIVAAATVGTLVSAAGPGFTTVDNTSIGDNVEHQITSAKGSCEATTVLQSGNWVIQSVAFKAGSAAPSFTLTADTPTSQTVPAGSQAAYNLTLAAVNGFSSPVTLTCSGLPTGAACGFSPPSPVTPGTSTADALTISTDASTTPVGTSTVTVTGTAGAIIKTATVTLIVTANTTPGFTMAATALSPATVAPGASATSTITITPTNGFTGSVTLSCSSITGGGTPAPACSFSALSGGISTLTVSTTANSAANPAGTFALLLLPIGGMTLLGAGFSSRRKMLVGILLICMLIAGFVFITSCGGGSSHTHVPSGGTPAGTYTITVSGAATGATTQTQTLTLVVN